MFYLNLIGVVHVKERNGDKKEVHTHSQCYYALGIHFYNKIVL